MSLLQSNSLVARLCLFGLLLGSPVLVTAQPVNAPLQALDDLRPGMPGEVWTVFKGHTPEPFAVVVTGILRNALGPGKNLILCELTDPRVQWEAVDADTALLTVPFGQQQEHFVARFDPQTGDLTLLESMRYKAASTRKTLWLNHTVATREVSGFLLGAVGELIWFDDGKPWAVFTVEDVRYNVDVDAYIRARGL